MLRILILTMSFLVTCNVLAENVIKKLELQSSILKEKREIWVSRPPSYKSSNSKYPVLYVLDAQSHFTITHQVATYLARSNRIPELIVVGIPLK